MYQKEGKPLESQDRERFRCASPAAQLAVCARSARGATLPPPPMSQDERQSARPEVNGTTMKGSTKGQSMPGTSLKRTRGRYGARGRVLTMSTAGQTTRCDRQHVESGCAPRGNAALSLDSRTDLVWLRRRIACGARGRPRTGWRRASSNGRRWRRLATHRFDVCRSMVVHGAYRTGRLLVNGMSLTDALEHFGLGGDVQ
jgi:hypothetical protein